jgi:two-component system chemotaxis response regulator CheY
MLKEAGFDVIEACNGDECLSNYNAKSPDLVLVDIVMPEKDGITAIKQIKSKNRLAKVVAMSGGLVLTPDAYLDEAREIGADYVIPKPLDRRQLLETIQNLLG